MFCLSITSIARAIELLADFISHIEASKTNIGNISTLTDSELKEDPSENSSATLKIQIVLFRHLKQN